MKKYIFLCFAFISISSFAQDSPLFSLHVEGKPDDPKKVFTLDIIKKAKEITITYKKVDSIRKNKIMYEVNDLETVKRIIKKNEKYFDSLSSDSLTYFQRKFDAIGVANSYFHTDSTTIYKSTHPAYWRLLETIFQTPNEVLEQKQTSQRVVAETFCFFTINHNGQKRNVQIENLDPRCYPLLAKLVNDSFEIIRAYQMVMQKRH